MLAGILPAVSLPVGDLLANSGEFYIKKKCNYNRQDWQWMWLEIPFLKSVTQQLQRTQFVPDLVLPTCRKLKLKPLGHVMTSYDMDCLLGFSPVESLPLSIGNMFQCAHRHGWVGNNAVFVNTNIFGGSGLERKEMGRFFFLLKFLPLLFPHPQPPKKPRP